MNNTIRLGCILLFSLPFSVKILQAQPLSGDFAWQSESPIKSPDYTAYFPDDPEAGKRLDDLIRNRQLRSLDAAKYLEAVRKGLRNTTNHKTTILGRVGSLFIWNQTPQNPQAIELMYHASGCRDESIVHHAVYSGLSVTRPKTPAILKRLGEIMMSTTKADTAHRIAWGSSEQREELIKELTLAAYHDDPAISERSKAMIKIAQGELKAAVYFTGIKSIQMQQEFGSRMDEFRQKLQSGTSTERLEILRLIHKHQLHLIMKDNDAWLKAYLEAAKDQEAQVRRCVASNIGSYWVWRAQPINQQAIDTLVMMANDSDSEVRANAMYYGLDRLPSNHSNINKVEQAKVNDVKFRIEKIRQIALQAIENGLYDQVDGLLHDIEPSPNRSYNNPEEKRIAEELFRELSDKLAAARGPDK